MILNSDSGFAMRRFARFSALNLAFIAALYFVHSTNAAEHQTTVTNHSVCKGVEYFHKQVSSVPWSIHVLRVERGRRHLGMVSTVPDGKRLGLTKLSEQMPFIPAEFGKAVAAINGDFFSWRVGPYQGDPAGLQIMNGELVSGPHSLEVVSHPSQSAAVWVDGRGRLHTDEVRSRFQIVWPDGSLTPFGLNEERDEDEIVLYTRIAGVSTRTTNGVELVLERAGKGPWLPLRPGEIYNCRVVEISGPNTPVKSNQLVLSIGTKAKKYLAPLSSGIELTLSTAMSCDIKGAFTAMGGGPVLVQGGKDRKLPDPIRHPRAAVGWNDKYLYFVVVDGRREGVSDGMSHAELAREMISWGCSDAMNLDGGASAMLWIHGEIKNQPSENRERPNANSLFIMEKKRWLGWSPAALRR